MVAKFVSMEPRIDHCIEWCETEHTFCSICYEYIEIDCIRLQVCKHQYHYTCIKRWLSKSNECPLCRQRINELYL